MDAGITRAGLPERGAEMFEHAALIEDTATDIDDGDLEFGEQWTPIDYVPELLP